MDEWIHSAQGTCSSFLIQQWHTSGWLSSPQVLISLISRSSLSPWMHLSGVSLHPYHLLPTWRLAQSLTQGKDWWMFSVLATADSEHLSIIPQVLMWIPWLSRATHMSWTKATHVHSEGGVVSTALGSDNTAQDSRLSGSLDHRTDWLWSPAFDLLKQFSGVVRSLLTMGNLRAQSTGTEHVSSTAGRGVKSSNSLFVPAGNQLYWNQVFMYPSHRQTK